MVNRDFCRFRKLNWGKAGRINGEEGESVREKGWAEKRREGGRRKKKEKEKETNRLRAKDDENDVSSAWPTGTCKCSLPSRYP